MQKIADIVRGLAEPVVTDKGCALWDVEYLKEGGSWILRILIDREGGVSIDACEAVSRALDPVLDAHDPIPDAYVLEVSSAGLERPLKRREHFDASIGRKVEVSLYAPQNGVKQFTGTLDSFDGQDVVITAPSGRMSFDIKAVSRVGWLFEF